MNKTHTVPTLTDIAGVILAPSSAPLRHTPRYISVMAVFIVSSVSVLSYLNQAVTHIYISDAHV